jgi:hypothetical protein
VSARYHSIAALWMMGSVSLISLPSHGAHRYATCLPYEPDTVSITGLHVRKTFPGPPNSESCAPAPSPEHQVRTFIATPDTRPKLTAPGVWRLA